MSAELLALLNAKIKDLRLLSPGFERITAHDISFALSFVRGAGPRLLGRVRYADQFIFLPPLQYQLLCVLKHRAIIEKWRNIKPLKPLAGLAISVYASPKRCSRCHGHGEKVWGGKILACPRCGVKQADGSLTKGTGWEPIFNIDFARAIGVSKSKWGETWRKRFGIALDILAKWDNRCIRRLSSALKKIDKPEQNS